LKKYNPASPPLNLRGGREGLRRCEMKGWRGVLLRLNAMSKATRVNAPAPTNPVTGRESVVNALLITGK